jgi:ribosomal protein S18 acetylase RimI-like enzyme
MVSYKRKKRIGEFELKLKKGGLPKRDGFGTGNPFDDFFRTTSHVRFDNMPVEVNPLAKKVQEALEQDISGLRAFSASCADGPLRLELAGSPSELKEGDFEMLLGLVEMTSGHNYRASSIGWNPRKKREEMMDEDMMYLLVRQGGGDDSDGSELSESSEEPSSIESSSDDDDDEDIEMRETEDAHMQGQEAIAEEKSAASQATPQPNALAQLIQAYASDSDDEEAPEPGIATPLAVPTTADNSTPSPRSEEHLRRVQQAYREATPQAPASHSDEPNVPATAPSTSPKPAALDRQDNRILGFISFMFTFDDPPHEDREVVYIYEIHLHEHLRGKGLGSHLIGFVESVSRKCKVEKTMLTVFTANEGARRMYERKGYEKDECSPNDRVMRSKVVKADYIVMSKLMD